MRPNTNSPMTIDGTPLSTSSATRTTPATRGEANSVRYRAARMAIGIDIAVAMSANSDGAHDHGRELAAAADGRRCLGQEARPMAAAPRATTV